MKFLAYFNILANETYGIVSKENMNNITKLICAY